MGVEKFACSRSGHVVGELLSYWVGKLGILVLETRDIFILMGLCGFGSRIVS